jgi:hypothetical protein
MYRARSTRGTCLEATNGPQTLLAAMGGHESGLSAVRQQPKIMNQFAIAR